MSRFATVACGMKGRPSFFVQAGQAFRYHQVRRMFAAVGNHVETLERVAIGPVLLDRSLGTGGWRFLTEDEIKALS